jgi:hypothetical protein
MITYLANSGYICGNCSKVGNYPSLQLAKRAAYAHKTKHHSNDDTYHEYRYMSNKDFDKFKNALLGIFS